MTAAQSQAPNILLTDVQMPNMNGIDLASQVHAVCPECKIFLFAGEFDTAALVKQLEDVAMYFPSSRSPSTLMRSSPYSDGHEGSILFTATSFLKSRETKLPLK